MCSFCLSKIYACSTKTHTHTQASAGKKKAHKKLIKQKRKIIKEKRTVQHKYESFMK